MRIIDAHLHYSGIQAFRDAAAAAGVDYSRLGLDRESRANGIVGHVCMGLSETAAGTFPDRTAATPMEAGLGPAPDGMRLCLGINPHTLDRKALEARIKPDVAGFKLYAGYYQIDINDAAYSVAYELAAERGLTVAIHMGDTYSEQGLLEYARPIHADRLAVRWPGVNFVLCHMGFPWVMEACEVAYKNRNVFLDMSGLVVGGGDEFDRVMSQPLMTDFFRQGLLFLNNYKKVLFGTDWPLAAMAPYIDLCKAITPESAWDDVFYNNADKLYF